MTLSRQRSFSLLLVQLLLFFGCAGPKRAVLPPSEGGNGDSQRTVRILEVGDFVRIETTSGEVFLGEVVLVTSESVTLGRTGNFGYEETIVSSAEISSIELNGGDSSGDAAGAVFKVIAAVLVFYAIAFFVGGTGTN